MSCRLVLTATATRRSAAQKPGSCLFRPPARLAESSNDDR
jgi:hypothetical protein